MQWTRVNPRGLVILLPALLSLTLAGVLLMSPDNRAPSPPAAKTGPSPLQGHAEAAHGLAVASVEMVNALQRSRGELAQLRAKAGEKTRGGESVAGKEQMDRLETDLRRMFELALENQRRLTLMEERFSSDLRELRKGSGVGATKGESPPPTSVNLMAGLLGIFGSASSLLLAWRSESRAVQLHALKKQGEAPKEDSPRVA